MKKPSVEKIVAAERDLELYIEKHAGVLGYAELQDHLQIARKALTEWRRNAVHEFTYDKLQLRRTTDSVEGSK